MTEAKPQLPVWEAHKRFKELLKKLEFADTMLMALLEHPRFKETGDGIFTINEVKIEVHEDMCRFVTEARKKYPMCQWAWNRKEFDRYQLFEQQPTEQTS